jgi:RNA polymerase sigma-70 factor (ECF subfamily)
MLPDEQLLIQKASKGDNESFSALVRQYQNRVFSFIMRMTANRDAALDLTQDTFLAAYQNLNSFRGESAFSTWLFQIAINKTRNHLKRSQREVPLNEDYHNIPAISQPDTDYEDRERQERLLGVIGSLPEGQRAVFNLRYFEHMKFEHIAKVHGVSVSAVKTQFAEAVKKLKKWLR